MIMEIFWLRVVLSVSLLQSEAMLEGVDKVGCMNRDLNLECPDGHVVVFGETVSGGPGEKNKTTKSCSPLPEDCQDTDLSGSLQVDIVQCVWRKQSCQLEAAATGGETCKITTGKSPRYLLVKNFSCIPKKDFYQMDTNLKVVNVSLNNASYLISEDHMHPFTGGLTYQTNIVAPPGYGVTFSTVYPLDLPNRKDDGNCPYHRLIFLTSGQTYGDFCGSDTSFTTDCLPNAEVKFETVPGRDGYAGFALRLQSCKIPTCDNSTWTHSCATDEVVAARLYGRGPGIHNGSQCSPAAWDCQHNQQHFANIACLWTGSECTFDVADVVNSDCASTYIQGEGTTCVPKSSHLTMSESDESTDRLLPPGSTIFVTSPGHPGPYPDQAIHLSMTIQAASGQGLGVSTLYPLSLPADCSTASLTVTAMWSTNDIKPTPRIFCGDQDLDLLPEASDVIKLEFNTSGNSDSFDGFALRVESFLLSTVVSNTSTALPKTSSLSTDVSTEQSTTTAGGSPGDGGNDAGDIVKVVIAVIGGLIGLVVLVVLLWYVTTRICYVNICKKSSQYVVTPCRTDNKLQTMNGNGRHVQSEADTVLTNGHGPYENGHGGAVDERSIGV